MIPCMFSERGSWRAGICLKSVGIIGLREFSGGGGQWSVDGYHGERPSSFHPKISQTIQMGPSPWCPNYPVSSLETHTYTQLQSPSHWNSPQEEDRDNTNFSAIVSALKKCIFI